MTTAIPRDKTEEWDMRDRERAIPSQNEALKELQARANSVQSPPEPRHRVVSAQINSQLDMIHSILAEHIKEARAQLDELEALIGDRCAKSKDEVSATAEMASTILNVTQSTAQTIKALRKE
jgi:hypothetical protein